MLLHNYNCKVVLRSGIVYIWKRQIVFILLSVYIIIFLLFIYFYFVEWSSSDVRYVVLRY